MKIHLLGSQALYVANESKDPTLSQLEVLPRLKRKQPGSLLGRILNASKTGSATNLNRFDDCTRKKGCRRAKDYEPQTIVAKVVEPNSWYGTSSLLCYLGYITNERHRNGNGGRLDQGGCSRSHPAVAMSRARRPLRGGDGQARMTLLGVAYVARRVFLRSM